MALNFCRRRFVLTAAAGALSLKTSAHARPSKPDQPLTIIVPFSKGGPTELPVQLLIEPLKALLNREIVIKNIAGRGGTLGAFEAATAPPDGSVLLAGNLGTHASAPQLYGNDLRYNPETDFLPVAMIASSPIYLVVRNDLSTVDRTPIRDFTTLVSEARAAPERFTIGHSGRGSSSHLAALYLMQLTKTRMLTVGYRGSGPALRDLQDGVFDMMCDQGIAVAELLKTGAVRALLAASETPNADDQPIPVPGSASVGLPEYDINVWNILFAPRGTAPEVLEALNVAVRQALKTPQVQAGFVEHNARALEDDRNRPDMLARFIKREIRRWSAVVRIAALQSEEADDSEE